MRLYIVRHGEAEKIGDAVTRDADRQLTARGEETVGIMGRALARIDRGIGTIITSPLARAIKTGALLKHELADKPLLRSSDNLSPGFRGKALLQEVLSLSPAEGIVVVGHEPDLSRFVAYLVADTASVNINMSTVSIAAIELSGTSSDYEARLAWFLTPDTVRALIPQP